MYKTQKKIVVISMNVIVMLAFIALVLLLIPARQSSEMSIYSFLAVAIVFFSVISLGIRMKSLWISLVRKKNLESGETTILNEFIDKLRFCYTLDDFYNAIGEVLEKKGDCSVLFIDRMKNYVLYNSPARLTTSEATHDKITQKFSESWQDGNFFFDRHFGVTSSYRKSRGFFLCFQQQQFFVFCRYTRLFDLNVYARLYEEYKRFMTRTRTISQLSEISSTTKEWEQLAETQQSFLPQKIPNIKKLKIATYFRPLVNVSGDYFSILPIDQNKTLLMLGDVSGKVFQLPLSWVW